MIYRSKAPLRISFSGGGTDIEPYVSEFGGCVISTTINKYVYATLKPREDKEITIYSKDLGVTEKFTYVVDGELKIVKSVMIYMNMLKEFTEGFDLYIESDVPVGSGLGLSSSLSVCLIELFCKYLGINNYSKDNIAHLAYYIERKILGIKGGYQDQFATSFGGFNYITFEKENIVVNPLRIKDNFINELENNLVLCYTGITRVGEDIIEKQINSYKNNFEYLHEIKELVYKMRIEISNNNLIRFSELFGETWNIKKKLTSGITTLRIDKLCKVGLNNGASGVRNCGAGGGGYLLFYCPNDKDLLKNALTEIGGTILDFHFENRGVQSWSI